MPTQLLGSCRQSSAHLDPVANVNSEQLLADEAFVGTLRRFLRARAMKRFPALRSHVDDLVNQAVADLWGYVSRRPEPEGLPADGRSESAKEIAGNELFRLAAAIISRRAADVYRHAAARWADETPLHEADRAVEGVADSRPSPARRALLRQMVQLCMAELARMPAADRELLWSIASDLGERRPALSGAERQRLSRARRRLAEFVQSRLGDTASALLAADLEEE